MGITAVETVSIIIMMAQPVLLRQQNNASGHALIAHGAERELPRVQPPPQLGRELGSTGAAAGGAGQPWAEEAPLQLLGK